MSFFHSLYSFSRISQQIFYGFTRKWIIFWETNQPTRTGNQPNESLAVERSKIGEIFSWGIVTFQQHGSNYIPGIWKYKQSMSFFPLFLFNILNYSFAYLSMRPFAFFSPLLLSQNSPPFSLQKKKEEFISGFFPSILIFPHITVFSSFCSSDPCREISIRIYFPGKYFLSMASICPCQI